MFKKFFLLTICAMFLYTSGVFAAPREPKPQIRPLKIEEQNYKYGNIEKSLKNPSENFYVYSDTEESASRKTSSALDIINTIMLIILSIVAILFISTKIKGMPFLELFKRKAPNNKFNILSAKQLSNGKTIYLVEVNGRQVIIGTTESKVDSIMPLDKSFSTEEIPPEYIEKLFNDTSAEFKNLEE
ncbi:MAG: flagellar biosynthetic protein FliO [bacterium]|nr:flagellar biosynthetic protein FliO [bacterium]